MASGSEKLQEFFGKAVGDFGAAISAVLMLIGGEWRFTVSRIASRITLAAASKDMLMSDLHRLT